MNHIIIQPSTIKGEIIIPPSKSICHRAVICAGLAEGESVINNVDFSEDIKATCSAMSELGAIIKKRDRTLSIKGIGKNNKKALSIDCGESGSTLRFMIPVTAAKGVNTTFTGRGKLVERPLRPYYDIFDEQQLNYVNEDGKLPLTIKGQLKYGDFNINGNISSQFISGLMFALPLLEGDSKIILNTALESKPYVDLTADMLKNFSIEIQNNDYREFFIKGKQKYNSADCCVEGDYSQAAFWLAAGILGADIECKGLKTNSTQGDKAIINIIKAMGGKINNENGKIKAFPGKTYGIDIDASETPDLVPILAVLGAVSCGTTRINKAGRLRIKESDRLKAISTELNKIGAEVIEKEDGLVIYGKQSLKGGVVESWNDHRIAMALAIASLRCSEPVIIKNYECVNKSYPDFWIHLKESGGNVNERDMG